MDTPAVSREKIETVFAVISSLRRLTLSGCEKNPDNFFCQKSLKTKIGSDERVWGLEKAFDNIFYLLNSFVTQNLTQTNQSVIEHNKPFSFTIRVAF